MSTKRCPYCAEEINVEAVRCRYCRSRLTSFGVDRWHRSHAEARLGGVCAAVGHALAVPVAAVRLVFVVLTFFHFLGPLLYGALWLVIPRDPGGESALEQLLGRAIELAGWLGGRQEPRGDEPRPDVGARRVGNGDGQEYTVPEVRDAP